MAHRASHPFLSIVAWPAGWDRERVVQLLAEVAGLDRRGLEYRLAQPPPMIVGQVEPFAAHRFVGMFTQHGGDAFASTFDDLAALGPTLKIKDLRMDGDGDLDVELWNGMSTTIRRTSVQVLIRARVARAPDASARPVQVRSMSPVTGRRVLSAGPTETRCPSVLSEKLDIHTTDGSVYQVDGDKFGFGILGDLRGHGDKANMDRLCQLLSHVSPDEIVDEYFAIWKAPSGYADLRLPAMQRNEDDPAFAFYSRWAALLYRHVMGVR